MGTQAAGASRETGGVNAAGDVTGCGWPEGYRRRRARAARRAASMPLGDVARCAWPEG